MAESRRNLADDGVRRRARDDAIGHFPANMANSLRCRILRPIPWESLRAAHQFVRRGTRRAEAFPPSQAADHRDVRLAREGKFLRQYLDVPARVLGDLVVGERQCPLLRFREMVKPDGRDRLVSERSRRFQPAMPRDEVAGLVDQHRVGRIDRPVNQRPAANYRLIPLLTRTDAELSRDLFLDGLHRMYQLAA